MESTLLIALTLSLLTPAAWADAPAGSTTKPIALPAGAKTPVITLDRVGGMILHKNPEPWFQINADGTAIAGDPYGWGRQVKVKLPADQLQDLLHFVLDQEKFDQINNTDLELRQHVMITDAQTTTIRVNAGGTDHTCGGRAVDMAAQQNGKNSPAAHFVAIANRLDHLRDIVALGGDAAVKKLLTAVNAQLKTDLPNEPPMTANDIIRAQPDAKSGEDVTFSRKTVQPNGHWHMTEADVTDNGKGKIHVKVEEGAEQPASKG